MMQPVIFTLVPGWAFQQMYTWKAAVCQEAALTPGKGFGGSALTRGESENPSLRLT